MMVPNLDNDDDSKNDENHLRRSRSESLPNSYSISDAQQNYQMNTPTAFQRRAERQVRIEKIKIHLWDSVKNDWPYFLRIKRFMTFRDGISVDSSFINNPLSKFSKSKIVYVKKDSSQ